MGSAAGGAYGSTSLTSPPAQHWNVTKAIMDRSGVSGTPRTARPLRPGPKMGPSGYGKRKTHHAHTHTHHAHAHTHTTILQRTNDGHLEEWTNRKTPVLIQ